MRAALATRFLSRAEVEVLQRLAWGERLVIAQVPSFRTLERRCLIRVDFGRADDHDKLVCLITDRGREAVAHKQAARDARPHGSSRGL